jgi:para-nitrobenzyl esterase
MAEAPRARRRRLRGRGRRSAREEGRRAGARAPRLGLRRHRRQGRVTTGSGDAVDTTAGANRFLPARKPQRWTGVRSSTSWGPVSPHPERTGWRNDEEQFLYQWDDGFAGEDMLRVNVWTPAVYDNRKRPVLVWIHGGGFVSGRSQELRPYDGSNLASRHDVVPVSMNHRLNAFGFLDLSEHGSQYAQSANVGILDLVAALEWVRDNVAGFGGDPGNVTISPRRQQAGPTRHGRSPRR